MVMGVGCNYRVEVGLPLLVVCESAGGTADVDGGSAGHPDEAGVMNGEEGTAHNVALLVGVGGLSDGGEGQQKREEEGEGGHHGGRGEVVECPPWCSAVTSTILRSFLQWVEVMTSSSPHHLHCYPPGHWTLRGPARRRLIGREATLFTTPPPPSFRLSSVPSLVHCTPSD